MPTFSLASTQRTEESYLRFVVAVIDFLLIQMTSKSKCTQCDRVAMIKSTINRHIKFNFGESWCVTYFMIAHQVSKCILKKPKILSS